MPEIKDSDLGVEIASILEKLRPIRGSLIGYILSRGLLYRDEEKVYLEIEKKAKENILARQETFLSSLL